MADAVGCPFLQYTNRGSRLELLIFQPCGKIGKIGILQGCRCMSNRAGNTAPRQGPLANLVPSRKSANLQGGTCLTESAIFVDGSMSPINAVLVSPDLSAKMSMHLLHAICGIEASPVRPGESHWLHWHELWARLKLRVIPPTT